ncbi:hypothetical protein B566_EDAN001566 [Ephemera danica]|nr:hypothetical protein B566_EDAN001566 [Ephemera danica]
MQTQYFLISYLLFILNAETSHAQQSQQEIIGELQEQLMTCNTRVRTLENDSIRVRRQAEQERLDECIQAVQRLLSGQSMTWPEAREFCRSKGMDLVAIESISENKAIASHGRALGAPFTSMNAWTSGCYSSERGEWVWHSTDQNLTYKNWWKTHGTNTFDGACIVLDSSDTTFLTGNITEPRPFICEL